MLKKSRIITFSTLSQARKVGQDSSPDLVVAAVGWQAEGWSTPAGHGVGAGHGVDASGSWGWAAGVIHGRPCQASFAFGVGSVCQGRFVRLAVGRLCLAMVGQAMASDGQP